MKLSKILHPEVIMNLRGPEEYRAFYRAVHRGINFIPGEGYAIDHDTESMWTASVRESVIITWKFIRERPPIYHAGKEFLEAISKIDRDVPVDLLPEKFFGYFSFAEKSVWDGSAWVQGIYVYIGPPEESPLKPELHENTKKLFWAVYFTEFNQGQGCECARILMDLGNEKFSSLASKVPIDPMGTQPGQNVFLAGLNLALYVNSIGCDLVKAPVSKNMKPADKKRLVESGNPINQCLLPVTLISWQYKNPRRQLVDSTWVDTFMRWQRCGPGNMQLKLIWVRPHERNFKGDKNENGVVHQDG